jgi:hypothetical protein
MGRLARHVFQRFYNDVRRLFGGRFFYALIFGLSKKMGYARTKTDKMDTKSALGAGHPVFYYRIAVNP